MRVLEGLLLAAGVAEAHYQFPSLYVGGKALGSYVNVRTTKNHIDNGFVADVTSIDIRCNELAGATATTYTAAAGSTIGFQAAPNIYHPGPLAFYMAKAPSGQTASTFEGDGTVWFKINQTQPHFGSALSWPTDQVSIVTTTIPSCIAAGDYLLRVEHIGLHSASTSGGAQFYHSCAQLTVTGGGSTDPPNKVALPGAYKATDPGLLINIYYPVPTNYTNPGPPVFTC